MRPFRLLSDVIAPGLCGSLRPTSRLFSQADRRASDVKAGRHPSLAGCVLRCLSVSVCPGFDHLCL